MTLGFLLGSKNFCKLLCVPWEVFVLHGYDWIHWVDKSCTTIAYQWLFRDSHPLLTTLFSAVTKSPKFAARCTTPPMRLLHGALAILVLWQISQFRSFGKWVLTLCLPKSALLAGVGSKDDPWEELACESLCSELYHPRGLLWTLAAIPVCRNDTSLSVLDRDSHFHLVLGFLVGLVNRSSRSFLSTCLLDTVTG